MIWCCTSDTGPKGTQHLQQEAIRKSNEANKSSAEVSQRYIKLPTKSINRLCETTRNSNTHQDFNKSQLNCPPNSCINHKSKLSPNSRLSLPSKTSKSVSVCPPLPKPPLTSVGVSASKSPSSPPSLLKHSPKPCAVLSPKPPPRPLTSHPGMSSSTSTTSTAMMSRHNVQQHSSINTSDTLTSAPNDDNVCTVPSNPTTRETSLTASALNASNSASSLERNGCQSVPNSAPLPSTSRDNGSDWNKSGAFINKPARGWLHPDHQMTDQGISYAVRYVGCLGINTSMKSLDFDTRSQIAKQCIHRVCELGRLKTPDKKRRPDKRITRMLADNPNMDNAGADVNLVITSSYLHLSVIETQENIATHEMPNISFASGGDADTLDFVAYVAKDHRYGRACFVLECGAGLAQDVITTIGQAFELRFKEFLKRTPKTTPFSDRVDASNGSNASHMSNKLNIENDDTNRLESRDYYNDLPGKIPPDLPDLPPGEAADRVHSADHTSVQLANQRVPQAAPRTGLKKCPQNSPNLIDLNIDIQEQNIGNIGDNTSQTKDTNCQQNSRSDPQYVNCSTQESHDNQIKSESNCEPSTQPSVKDPFDMKPFDCAIAEATNSPAASAATSSVGSQLEAEDWFHGPISRKESETLVAKDGDFLVRESQGSAGQYVLTGMQSGIRKHLLLVDPEGVVSANERQDLRECQSSNQLSPKQWFADNIGRKRSRPQKCCICEALRSESND
ncbi:unnamed protein product [Oppiella nova]|uniref:SHC-transforming protein 1 n=1 Tax=Oppiella nova TaxID=334625 RepID=A0A7R9M0E5_9ACAR|nr:unnamed protein product [Oppiella nova]CAG2168738.1 unnamed protein product [Oppiella nova]